MLYSEALSPWRHLDKVRAIVCFCFFLFLVLGSAVLHMAERGKAAGEEGPFLFVVFMSADEWAVINTFFDGTFARLDCWQPCQFNWRWTVINVSHKASMVAFLGRL